mgnify:CR=1 FL=1
MGDRLNPGAVGTTLFEVGMDEGFMAPGDLRALDAQIEKMKTVLEQMRPQRTSEALAALREQFPDTPLSARVAVTQHFARGPMKAAS